jgi:predicted anti-sigma-YlaC factor YlaD
MKCSIVRDLLPLYALNKCRRETRETVEEHLRYCEGCRELQEAMHVEVGLKDSIEVERKPAVDEKFWSRYYGGLLVKGLIVFLIVYGVFAAFLL